MLKIDTTNLTSPWLKVQALTKVIQFKSDTKGPIKTPLFGGASSKAKPEEQNTDRLKIFIASWNMYGRLVSELDSFLNSNNKNKQERMDQHQQQSSSNKIFVEHDGESPFLDSSSTHPYHLIVIGTQECERDIAEALFFPSKEVWERRLSDYLGECYQLLECETLAALHLAVFVWKPVASYVSNVHSGHIKTGWANMISNKGAVAISLNFGSRSLLFINCHLRAHQTKLTERNANVHRILHELQIKGGISSHKHASKKNLRLSMDKLSRVSSSIMVKKNNNKKKNTRDTKKNKEDPNSKKTTKTAIPTPTPTPTSRNSHTKEIIKPSKNVIERFDHVFFFGDTNYRINAERKTVLEAIQKKDFTTLLKHDQLSIERQNGTTPLSAFKEHIIQFIPTYKFDTLEIPSSSSSSSSDTDSPTSSSSIMIQQKQQQQTPPLLSPETPSTATTTSSSSSSILITPTDTFQLHGPMSVCYDTSPKQRVPSFTDRILWSDKKLDDTNNNNSRPSLIRSATTFSNSPSITTTATARPKLKNIKWISAMKWKNNKNNNNNNHGKDEEVINKETVCYHYDAVMDQRLIGASDHLPVVGVFGIWFNEWDLQKRAKSIKSIKKISLWKKWKSWS